MQIWIDFLLSNGLKIKLYKWKSFFYKRISITVIHFIVALYLSKKYNNNEIWLDKSNISLHFFCVFIINCVCY